MGGTPLGESIILGSVTLEEKQPKFGGKATEPHRAAPSSKEATPVFPIVSKAVRVGRVLPGLFLQIAKRSMAFTLHACNPFERMKESSLGA